MITEGRATARAPTKDKTASQLRFPLQWAFLKDYSPQELDKRLEEFLIFGTAPETLRLASREDKINYLAETINSRLLQRIISLETVRAPEALHNLLRLLAFHIGSEVSVGELAIRLGVDGKTISRYLELLERAGIILRLSGFGRKLPNEITRKSRYYFFNNGIRNGLLAQFNGLKLRGDAEQLWENFLIAERFKKWLHSDAPVSGYFWRTYAGQQLELVEEDGGKLCGYGFKFSYAKTPRIPKAWFGAYPEAHYYVINLSNYQEFIS